MINKTDPYLNIRFSGYYCASCTIASPIYGPSLLLILAACGGSSGGGDMHKGADSPSLANNSPPSPPPLVNNSPPSPLQIHVLDVPPSGADVFVDMNGNKELNPLIDFFIGKTNQDGFLSVKSQADNQFFLASLNVNTDKSNPNNILSTKVWRAPEGSTVISPLTELLVEMGSNKESIAKLLKLPAGMDVTQFDPYKLHQNLLYQVQADAVKLAASVVSGILTTAGSLQEIEAEIRKAYPVHDAVFGEKPELMLAENANGSNTAINIGIVTATDEDGDRIIYSLKVSHTDFALNPKNGQITYTGTNIDYETHATKSVNLTVIATSKGVLSVDKSIEQVVTIAITNVDDAGIVAPLEDAEIDVVLFAPALTDDDGATLLTYQWEISDTRIDGIWKSIDEATLDHYTPISSDAGQFIRVKISYLDGYGPKKELISDAKKAVTIIIENVQTEIYENYPLNKAIYDFGAKHDTSGKSYKFHHNGSDNDLFTITNGQLFWKAPPDYEKPNDKGNDNIYQVDVAHTASFGFQTNTRLDIKVQDILGEYLVGVEDVNRPQYYYYNYDHSRADKPLVKHLIPDNHDYTHLLLGHGAITMPATGPLEITWSIITDDSVSDRAVTNNNALEILRANFEKAFASFEEFINVKFIEVQDTKESVGVFRIQQGFSSRDSNESSTTYNKDGGLKNLVTIAIASGHNDKFSAYAHEIGHALGLKHPFSENGEFGFPFDINELSTLNSIMTYGSHDGRKLTQSDINALQFLYGKPGTNYEGLESRFDRPEGGDNKDVVIGGGLNDNLYEMSSDGILKGDSGYDYLDVGNGNDVLDGGAGMII